MNKAEQKPTVLAESKQRKPKAQRFASLIKKGRNNSVKFRAFRSTPKFRRLKRSLRTVSRNPQYLRRSVTRQNTWDRYSILQAPCTSERFYKKMETENTIIFFVNPKANKIEISQAFKDAFNIKPERINTLNTLGGRKKAYIKIPKGTEASEIANKIGLI